jgi:hypothetical protein
MEKHFEVGARWRFEDTCYSFPPLILEIIYVSPKGACWCRQTSLNGELLDDDLIKYDRSTLREHGIFLP